MQCLPNLSRATIWGCSSICKERHGISYDEPKFDSDHIVDVKVCSAENVIQIVLSVYKNSLSQRIQYYIEDYLLILNRYIMKEHESVKIAQQLYKNHREAIDFIIENITNFLKRK